MTAKPTTIAFLAIIAVALSAAGVGYAYAYSSSVSSLGNPVGGDWLSIDVYSGNNPADPSASPATSVSFTVDGSTPTYGVDSVTYSPADPYSIRVSSSMSQGVSVMGSFSVTGTNPAAGAAILSVTFVFSDGTEMVLAGGHSIGGGEIQQPTVRNIAALSACNSYYAYDLVVSEITITLVSEIQESSGGNAYVVAGGSGSEIPIGELVDPNNLSYSFLTYRSS